MPFNISSMLNPAVYDHKVESVTLIETHISWVLLTGKFAYKIKKPVNFGFLDFSSLKNRKIFCEQELQLNQRLAASIYLEVVSITGTADKPHISQKGEAFEYAVKMQEFPQSCQLDQMLAAGELNLEHMDAFALKVAEFHQAIPVANKAMDYGSLDSIEQPVADNFLQIHNKLTDNSFHAALNKLKLWSDTEFSKLTSIFTQRKLDGFVRECHGDMHLRNLVWLDNKPVVFDCIEFNPAFRWIDVISDIAFLVMDLQDRKQLQFANRFLNTYLEVTGNYNGLSVLKFYLCYRAMVRAKVNTLRLSQALENKDITTEETDALFSEIKTYLELATEYIHATSPQLIIMRGFSASGKSSVSQKLLDTLGAIRIRSDVERKRLFSISTADKSASEIDAGIYSSRASQQTYEKLLELSEVIIKAGYSVIVDAAFLKYTQRETFSALANRLSVPFKILNVTATAEVLRQRIVARKQGVSDADLTVLEHQLANTQALKENELNSVISIDTTGDLNLNKVLQQLRC